MVTVRATTSRPRLSHWRAFEPLHKIDMPPPPPPPAYNPTGVLHHNIPSFRFSNGTVLNDIKVAYRSINPSAKSGTILIPTCFSGHINSTLTFTQQGWGVNALADYHVVVAAMLGNGESSSPSNKLHFPEPGQLRYEDTIHAHFHMLTTALNISSLEAVVGFSMGGQQAYHWAVMYPRFVKRIVGICTSARTTPHNYAFLEGPIAALINSVDYVAWKQAKTMILSSSSSSSSTSAGTSYAGSAVGAGGEKSPNTPNMSPHLKSGLSPTFSTFNKNSNNNSSNIQATDDLYPALQSLKPPQRGLAAFGRTYAAWLTSAEWHRELHWHRTLGHDSIESYLRSQEQSKHAWDPDDLLCLARTWQQGDIGKTFHGQTVPQPISSVWSISNPTFNSSIVSTSNPGKQDNNNNKNPTNEDEMLERALQSIKCPVLLIPSRSDQYFRPSESVFEMKHLRDGRLAVIETDWGHSAGGGACAEDTRFVNDMIAQFLMETQSSAASWSWV